MEHAQIRKLLSTGFSEKAIRDREGIIQVYISLLIERFEERAEKGEKMDVTWWFDCLGADLAGKLGYGESFGALEMSTLPAFIPVMDKLPRGLTIGLALQQYPVLKTVGGILRMVSPFERIFTEVVGSKVRRREKRLDAGQEDEAQDFYSF
ncbi:hypothetical protein IFR05_004416 [Cadophora sp. M221]|nr:hypothetical protein IFR05_004416 [Cadophora sp. M221]